MKLIQSLMGRRQFLVAAGVTSALGLGYKKLAGVVAPDFQTGVAMASDRPGTTDMKGAYSNRYSHLLSPIKIGNVVLKNRMMHTQSLPHFFQGPETFPSEQIISHYANIAKNGSSIVTIWSPDIIFSSDGDLRDRKELPYGDSAHMPMWDASDPGVQNYFAQMTDAIHFYDAKASMGIRVSAPKGYNIGSKGIQASVGPEEFGMPKKISVAKEIPVELIQKTIEETVSMAKFYKDIGFDMVNFHMSYGSSILAHVLSPVMNTRTDMYGGSPENRARFALEIFQAIKKACGQDFLIAAHISGEEDAASGYTVEDAVQYAKLWEGALDILQLRAKDDIAAHPMGHDSQKEHPVTLAYAQAIKEGGSKMITAPVGGYQDLDLNEEYIATGKTDMIAMARAWIADPEYGKKAYEGRGEDVVPCIRCNKCHGDSTWLNFCSVNPKLGLMHRLNRMIDHPGVSKKVAVIGGGPAGMRAAVIAADRGHKVTLYEKNDFLGGLLRHTDFVSIQWPVKDYKDYLIRQMDKLGIEVLLNTKAALDMIRAKGYDAIIVASGSEPIIPDIPGVDSSNVWNCVNVFGNENALGKDVVVIGGGRGAKIGLHLAQCGHKVTVLESGKELVPRGGPHQGIFYNQYMDDNFSAVLEAITSRISNGKVIYTDAKGVEKSIQADSVVIYAGLKPRLDEAMKFSGAANRFFIIGDCREVGNIQKCNRTAYAAASSI